MHTSNRSAAELFRAGDCRKSGACCKEFCQIMAGLVERFDTAKAVVRLLENLPDLALRKDVGVRATRLLEACLHSYGRCVLNAGTQRAELFADMLMFHRASLRDVLSELHVSHDGGRLASIAKEVDGNVTRLMETLDAVLFRLNVRCATTSSGLSI